MMYFVAGLSSLLALASSPTQAFGSPEVSNARLQALVSQSLRLKPVNAAFQKDVEAYRARSQYPDPKHDPDVSLKSEDDARKLLETLKNYPGSPQATKDALELVMSADAKAKGIDMSEVTEIQGPNSLAIQLGYLMAIASAHHLEMDRSFRSAIVTTFAHFVENENRGPSPLVEVGVCASILRRLVTLGWIKGQDLGSQVAAIEAVVARYSEKARNETRRPTEDAELLTRFQDELRISTAQMKRVGTILSSALSASSRAADHSGL